MRARIRHMVKKGDVIRTSIDKLMNDWIEKCRMEKDAHIAISADEGDGKSTLLGSIVKRYPDSNMKDNIVYTNNVKEFYDKYNNITEGTILGIDEALDLINRLDWHRAEVKDLVKHIRGKVRKEKRAAFVYNVQLFRDLHSYWRNHRIRYWIELTPREWFSDTNTNRAYVLERSRVPFITGKRDAWLLDENEKVWLGYMSGGRVKPEYYINMLRGHPFYSGEFRFRNDESVVEKYNRYRRKAMDEYAVEEPERKIGKLEQKWRGRCADYIINLHNQFNMKYNQIATIPEPPFNLAVLSKLVQDREEGKI